MVFEPKVDATQEQVDAAVEAEVKKYETGEPLTSLERSLVGSWK